VRGYDRLTCGHIDAAWHVYAGHADCCLATSAAARVFGLDFIPLGSDRYDLVIPRRFLDLRAVDAMLDRMTGRGFRLELEALGGYETSQTGKIVL
jgi:putative molybdopterin biosynthesis protein